MLKPLLSGIIRRHGIVAVLAAVQSLADDYSADMKTTPNSSLAWAKLAGKLDSAVLWANTMFPR